MNPKRIGFLGFEGVTASDRRGPPMFLQLRLSMAAMAIEFHVTTSARSVSLPTVFGVNRELF
jgi:hypothetical protein